MASPNDTADPPPVVQNTTPMTSTSSSLATKRMSSTHKLAQKLLALGQTEADLRKRYAGSEAFIACLDEIRGQRGGLPGPAAEVNCSSGTASPTTMAKAATEADGSDGDAFITSTVAAIKSEPPEEAHGLSSADTEIIVLSDDSERPSSPASSEEEGEIPDDGVTGSSDRGRYDHWPQERRMMDGSDNTADWRIHSRTAPESVSRSDSDMDTEDSEDYQSYATYRRNRRLMESPSSSPPPPPPLDNGFGSHRPLNYPEAPRQPTYSSATPYSPSCNVHSFGHPAAATRHVYASPLHSFVNSPDSALHELAISDSESDVQSDGEPDLHTQIIRTCLGQHALARSTSGPGSHRASTPVDPIALARLDEQEERIARMKQIIERMESTKQTTNAVASPQQAVRSPVSTTASPQLAASSPPTAVQPSRPVARNPPTDPRLQLITVDLPAELPPPSDPSSPASLDSERADPAPAARELAKLMAVLHVRERQAQTLFTQYQERLQKTADLKRAWQAARAQLSGDRKAYNIAARELDRLRDRIQTHKTRLLNWEVDPEDEASDHVTEDTPSAECNLPIGAPKVVPGTTIAPLGELKRKLSTLEREHAELREEQVVSRKKPAAHVSSSIPAPLVPAVPDMTPPSTTTRPARCLVLIDAWARQHPFDRYDVAVGPALPATVQIKAQATATADADTWFPASTFRYCASMAGFIEYEPDRWLWPADVIPLPQGPALVPAPKHSTDSSPSMQHILDLDKLFAPPRPATPGPQVNATALTSEVNAALRPFRAFRLHPLFTGDLASLTYTPRIDPNRPFCVYETTGGDCRDPGCQSTHFRDLTPSADDLVCDLLAYVEGRTPLAQQAYHDGLMRRLYAVVDGATPGPAAMSDLPQALLHTILAYRQEHLRGRLASLPMSRVDLASDPPSSSTTPAEPSPAAAAPSADLIPLAKDDELLSNGASLASPPPLLRWLRHLSSDATAPTGNWTGPRPALDFGVLLGDHAPVFATTVVPPNTNWLLAACQKTGTAADGPSKTTQLLTEACQFVRNILTKETSTARVRDTLRTHIFIQPLAGKTVPGFDLAAFVDAAYDHSPQRTSPVWLLNLAVVYYALRRVAGDGRLWLPLLDLVAYCHDGESSDLAHQHPLYPAALTVFQTALECCPDEPLLWWQYLAWVRLPMRRLQHLCQFIMHFTAGPAPPPKTAARVTRSLRLADTLVVFFQYHLHLAHGDSKHPSSNTLSCVADWLYALLTAPTADAFYRLIMTQPAPTATLPAPAATDPALTASWLAEELLPEHWSALWLAYLHVRVYGTLALDHFVGPRAFAFLPRSYQPTVIDWARARHYLEQRAAEPSAESSELDTVPVASLLGHAATLLGTLAAHCARHQFSDAYIPLMYNYAALLRALETAPALIAIEVRRLQELEIPPRPETADLLFRLNTETATTDQTDSGGPPLDLRYFEEVVRPFAGNPAVWNRLAKVDWRLYGDPVRVAELLARAINVSYPSRSPLQSEWRYLQPTVTLYLRVCAARYPPDTNGAVPDRLVTLQLGTNNGSSTGHPETSNPSSSQAGPLSFVTGVEGPVARAELVRERVAAREAKMNAADGHSLTAYLYMNQLYILLYLAGESPAKFADPDYFFRSNYLHHRRRTAVEAGYPAFDAFRFACEAAERLHRHHGSASDGSQPLPTTTASAVANQLSPLFRSVRRPVGPFLVTLSKELTLHPGSVLAPLVPRTHQVSQTDELGLND
ncbi:hypothetical protein IWQ60_005749 [Tieghemiomyces parasiticus]|uniref:Putative zinc-finger domain-containing protein n=1 Tax=Tieghemiomyces parasiticus TaxID=78921 RepID=A0A9W8A986_9FUNG|nr:hypothetical protein IWQ60_005749 [Tieghemiomyces parasiticus]